MLNCTQIDKGIIREDDKIGTHAFFWLMLFSLKYHLHLKQKKDPVTQTTFSRFLTK